VNRTLMRRLLAILAVGLFLAAMCYPFQPTAGQGLLGPLGQALFYYVLIGWVFILLGVDPTGAGAFFSLISPWPSLTVILALLLAIRPAFRLGFWLQGVATTLGLFSPIVAWRLADPVSAVPLAIWSASCIVAVIAIVLPARPAATTPA
jgi:hypothetical protein